MLSESIFRAVFIVAGVVMFVIRLYYQRKVFGERGTLLPPEPQRGLRYGAVAALCALGFGAAYIVKPGWPAWAFALPFPTALRVLGALLLAGGLALLFLAHHYLALNFSSYVRVREEHTLVEDGPYRWIRHPIYTAYVMSYVGGGLVSGNWVLTLVPTVMFALMIALRVGQEEAAMLAEFGEQYRAYMQRTGRFLPRWGGGGPARSDVR
jgi:protein-S-isoprenylcysteine O-methyltransferase Ste14